MAGGIKKFVVGSFDDEKVLFPIYTLISCLLALFFFMRLRFWQQLLL